MANYTFNIAKGRVVEFYNRVESNDPSTSALILIPLSVQGTESEAQDYDTVAAVLGGTSDEQTSGGWVRKTLTDTLKYQTPSGATTTLVYLTDAALKKSSTGIYYADISLTEDGIWTYRYESTGTGQAAGEGQLFAKSAL